MNNGTLRDGRKDEPVLNGLLDHLSRLLPDGTSEGAFRACMRTAQPATVRLNPLVAASCSLLPLLRQRGRPVPWCPDAFSLPDPESRLGHTLEFGLGAIYIQAAATTLAVEALAPRPGERVLDLCAAPGGKLTQIAARMGNTGLVVANEPRRRREPALVGHLERCGVANTVVTRALGAELARWFPNYFDRVLLDAPCSGDGVLRKSVGMLRYWSVEDARRQAQTQIGLLRAAFHMLKPGGTLVYSTCSLSTEENEEVLMALLRRGGQGVQIMPVEVFSCPPLPPSLASAFPQELGRAVRVWPHLHDTEGAFVARLGKVEPTTWSPQPHDAGTWPVQTASTPEALAAAARLEHRWGLAVPVPAGHVLAVRSRCLVRLPGEAQAIAERCPFVVRSGMRVGRLHRGYVHLSHQAVGLWGPLLQGPAVELDWEQVRRLFGTRQLALPPGSLLHGEVLCRFGPWSVCRAMAEEETGVLQAMLPRSLCRPGLERLG
ncbi:MAG: NOL1/NOP2/sun family putative RNA methylase [Candidatus Latescibacterota bacterium]